MADEPATPANDEKPATPPRRAPRKTAAADSAAKPARRGRPPKSTVEKAEDAVVAVAKKPAAAVASATKSATSAAKSAAKSVKPRSSKRTTPRASTRKTADDKKKSGGWGKTAIAGGLAVAGAAATAAVFALRSSTPKSTAPEIKGAHQADGTDSSKSFEAGIADEGTIPDA